MTRSGKTTPPASDPRPGHNPGYPEPKPRDREDAQQPHAERKPDPDEGGLGREPEKMPER